MKLSGNMQTELAQKQTQRLVLSQEIQLSLRLLHLPIMELRQVISQQMLQNPVLEEVEDDRAETEAVETERDELEPAWEDYLPNMSEPLPPEDEDRGSYLENSLRSKPPNLREHLLRQLRISSPSEMAEAKLLVENIDDSGYLRTSIEQIAGEHRLPPEKLKKALTLIHSFDPPGVGARDLRESLLIQLRLSGEEDSLPFTTISLHFEALKRKKYSFIAEKLGVKQKEVRRSVERITTLEPNPGSRFNSTTARYITPEIVLRRVKGNYQITLNDENMPRLRINPFYRKLMEKGADHSGLHSFLSEKFKEALWVIRSINQRQNTILKVTRCIIEEQKEFLEKGAASLKPLRLSDVAEKVGLHESTISRAVTNKYIETEKGTLELKDFFSTAIKKGKQPISAGSIKASISSIVAEENPKNPLSDARICSRLSEKGMKIARRTVAKYREELRILPHFLRRREGEI